MAGLAGTRLTASGTVSADTNSSTAAARSSRKVSTAPTLSATTPGRWVGGEIDRLQPTGAGDNPMVSATDPFDGALVDRLRALHEHYVDAVNRAVEAGRDDLVAELVADYPDEALAVMTGCAVNGRPDPPRRFLGGSRYRCQVARWIATLRAAIR
jgi:hypothetical protein